VPADCAGRRQAASERRYGMQEQEDVRVCSGAAKCKKRRTPVISQFDRSGVHDRAQGQRVEVGCAGRTAPAPSIHREKLKRR
jgi:hypothetical protein